MHIYENNDKAHILHISALQLWGMEGNAGMCCLQETLKGHVRAGYSVTVIIPAYDIWDDGMTPVTPATTNGIDVHVAPCSWMPMTKRIRLLLQRLGTEGLVPYVLGRFFGMMRCFLLTTSLFLTALRVRRRVRTRFDLVYAHNQWAALAGWLAGRAFGVPNVTRLYGTFLADLMKKPLICLRYPIAVAGFLVPHHLLICANDGTRGDEVATKLRINPKRFRFWQDGVDEHSCGDLPNRKAFLKNRRSCLREEAKWILTCSRLSYWKRIDRMIRALSYARNLGIDCQLLIAGDGQERSALMTLAEELRVDENIAWLGAIPHAGIPELMDIVDVFMITNDVTNRCNPLFEAIRARLPVVSVCDNSTADLLEHGSNALLADRDNIEDLGRHLAQVCTDEPMAASMRRNQQARAGDLWNWQQRMNVEIEDLQNLLVTSRAQHIGETA